MHAYTLPPTQLVYRHRIVEYKAGFPHDMSYVDLRYPAMRFSGNARDILPFIKNALYSNENGLSCKAFAKLMDLPKSTVYDRLQTLLRNGTVQRHMERDGGYSAYVYQIATANPNPIRRSPYYWWKRCPSCGDDRKLRRMASGNYEHWCGCGHFQVISKEEVK